MLSPEIIQEARDAATETAVSNLDTVHEKIPDVQVEVKEHSVVLKAVYKGQFLGIKRLAPTQLRDATLMARLIPTWENLYNAAILKVESDEAVMVAAADWAIQHAAE
jgi:hypothetical protein